MKHPVRRFLALFLVLVFCFSLFPAAALAEDAEELAPEFLLQPMSGSVPAGEDYLVTWRLNLTPDRLELAREEDQPGEDGLPETLLVPERELDPADTSLRLAASEETVWRLRAFYGEKELISDAFTVTEEPAEESEDPSSRPEGLAQDDSEEEPAEKPEAEPQPEDIADEPAAADEPEELRKLYTLSGQVLTFKSNGSLDTTNTGGAIQVSASSANNGSVVTCQTQAASGYRLVAVYFGPTSAPKTSDVTANKRAIMPSEAAVFTACFIPESANMPCGNAAVRLSAPPLGGSYSGLVNADVSKYYNKDGAGYSALDAYSVSAVWKEEGGANPASFQIGKRYYAVITVTFNSGWSLASNFSATLTTPDGSILNSGSDFLMERVPGGVSFQSPLYTVPETEGWHNLYADVITYDENGDYDANLTGGTVTLSTGCAQEGATVSCTVTVNSGFRLLCVEMGSPHGEPVCDVTDTLQGTMLNRDTDFRAFFITEGAIKPTGAFSVTVTAPAAGTSNANGIPAEVTKSFDAGWPASYHVENAYWRNSSNNLVTTLMPGWTYYPVFDLVPNEGWCFSDSPGVLLQYSDLTYFEPNSYDYTLRADGSIHVFGPPYTLPGSSEYQQVIYTVYTADASGELQIGNSSGGTVTLSTDHARPGDTVTVTATPNSGYRLARVLFGTGDHKFYDVTDTLQGTVEEPSLATPISNFNVTFVPDGVRISTYPAAAVRIGAPGAGGNYPNGVPVNTTKYYVDGGGVRFLPSAFEVENAVWTIKYGGTPTTLLAGHKYLAEFDIVPGDCFFFPTDETPYVILTMPDGTEKNSEDGDFTVTRNADGSLHVASPEVTLPGSSSYHNLMGRALTYDENGIYDESLAGGTVTVSAGSAKAGDAVSCQVTVNPGYRLLMVQFCLDHDEPAADVTDSLQAVMWDRDMEFRATFVKDGGSIGCQAAAVRLEDPDSSGYASLPAATVTKYFSMTTWAVEPTAYRVTNAAWRDDDGQCVGKFYSVRDYYATFTLTPNEGWHFEDNFSVELTMPDGSVLKSYNGDFTITRNPDGSVDVKTPLVSVPDTQEPTDGSMALDFTVEVFDADYHSVPDVIGGTASFSPTHPRAGDTVTVTAEPAPGYQLQYVYYDDGVTMGYDATPEMSYVIPANYGTLSVCFTPVGTSLPLPSATQKVELPLAGALNSGSGRVLNGEHQWYDVESVTWYGGAGSGCQGQEPTRFLPGASYYAEVVLTPHAHWHWKTDAHPLVLYHDPSDPDPNSVNWDLHPDFSGSTCSLDSQGRLHIVGQEIPLPASTLGSVDLGIQMFQEGGEYPEGCPVVFELPDDAFFTVSNAVWYNYANQESGGIGLAAGFFTADGRYFTEFDLIPNQGYEFTANTQVVLTNGEVELKRLNSDGSLHVVTSWYSLDPENAAQYRRVFVTNYVMNADGSANSSGSGGYVLPNDGSPKVGDTLIFGVMPKNGYRLQWMTAARDSEQIGEDITDSLAFYVADEPGDVYVSAFFAPAEEPVTCSTVDLNVQLPAPGGNYSGLAPATVTPNAVNASKYTVVSARWYEIQEHGVGTPSSFVPGEQYCVEIILAPNPGWCFGDNPGAFLLFSDGTGMDSRFGEITPYKQSDGNLVLTSDFITLPEVEIDSVELSLDLPELGSSFVAESKPWATFYTPHVGEMYTLWKNGADQATGAKDSVTASFQPGCVYYATVRIHADPGYYLTADTQVTLRNGLSFTTQYLETDRSLWIHTESIAIPTDSYQLSGTYVKFRLNGEEINSARPGDYVVVRTDITTQPLGVYLSNVTSEDVELTQLTDITWGFAMPAKNVSVTGELLPQETYIFELEDMTHDVNAADARWLFGEQEAGTRLEQDLDCDGHTDIFVDYYEDGTVRVIRVGNIYGDLTLRTPSGRFGTMIYRFGPERYDLYLGSVQVNAENKNDIPVLGGKASYDPATRTLNLTGYTGSIGVARPDSAYPSLTNSFSITASGDLNITGSGTLLDASLRGGISCGGNLTLNGDFVIYAWLHGIYAEGDLTVSGNVKVHDSTQVGVGVGGTLRVLLGSLRVTTDEGIGVDSRGDVIVAGDLFSEAGEAGLQCGGNVTLVGGTIWVSSTNDIGLICSSDLNVQNGGFTAYGNIQALEVASISFDNATHFISLPVNGTVSDDDTTIIDPSTGDPALNAQITDKKPTLLLGVKDLDGNEGVGGYVSFGDGDYFVETSNTVPYGTWLDISASAAPGYLFDHWEDAYGHAPNDESDRAETSVGVYVDNVIYAVFEELLPINAANFPDANFRSYISANFDLNSDGYLSWAERNAVTSIDVSNKSIGNLVGLRYFTELTRLYCYGNPDLREVDVRQNKKILYVQCYSCSKLERLYITGCSELRDLRCYSCNLSSINFSGCTNLKMLQCYGNKLSYLYLGDCHQLGRVDCQNNPNLSELNINSEDLYILFCYSTKLDTLDVSSCPKLFDTYRQGEFSQTSSYDRYYWVDGSTIKGEIRCNKSAEIESDLGIPVNQPNFPDPVFREFISNSVDLNHNGWLSPLEIEQCSGIGPEDMDFHNVKGIEFLTEMDNLLIDGAPNLTSIDLRANTKLEVIDVCDNGLQEIKLDGLTNLYALYVESNALTEFDISAFTLETFYCYNNPLTSLELGEQAELRMLRAYWTDLEELDLSGCPLLLDAYLNGEQTVTENAERGNYIEYAGPQGGVLYLDADQVVVTEETLDHMPGDINGDGKVNTADVTLLAKYVKARGQGVEIAPGAGNVDGSADGKVTTADVALLAKYVKARGQGVVIY